MVAIAVLSLAPADRTYAIIAAKEAGIKQSMEKRKSRRLWYPKKSREEYCVEDLD